MGLLLFAGTDPALRCAACWAKLSRPTVWDCIGSSESDVGWPTFPFGWEMWDCKLNREEAGTYSSATCGVLSRDQRRRRDSA